MLYNRLSHKYTMILNNSFDDFCSKLFSKKKDVDDWFISQFSSCPAPFYSSIDTRFCGYKSAAIDANFFPAGFNIIKDNLNSDYFSREINRRVKDASNIFIIAEEFDRNKFYFEHLSALCSAIEHAGFNVQSGQLGKDFIVKENKLFNTSGIYADFVIINNDFSKTNTGGLENLEHVSTPPQLGWHNRKKSTHFSQYNQCVDGLCHAIALKEQWHIVPEHRSCSTVDFMTKIGMDCISRYSGEILNKINFEYDKHRIKDKPFIVIKPEAGTFGMGVMSIDDPKDVYTLNRKQRTKMSATKSNRNDKVVIQEGIPTAIYSSTNHPAELVFYFIGDSLAGTFLRSHEKQGTTGSLNKIGMQFETVNKHDSKEFYTQYTVARLSLLACAKEIDALN